MAAAGLSNQGPFSESNTPNRSGVNISCDLKFPPLDNLGLPDHLVRRLEKIDNDGDGVVSHEELLSFVDDLIQTERRKRYRKLALLGSGAVLLLFCLSTFAMVWCAVALAEKIDTQNSGASGPRLADKSTGATLRTAAARLLVTPVQGANTQLAKFSQEVTPVDLQDGVAMCQFIVDGATDFSVVETIDGITTSSAITVTLVQGDCQTFLNCVGTAADGIASQGCAVMIQTTDGGATSVRRRLLEADLLEKEAASHILKCGRTCSFYDNNCDPNNPCGAPFVGSSGCSCSYCCG